MCGGTADDPICKPNNDVATCGNSCMACPAPAVNGKAGCNGTACTVTCDDTYHQCWQDSAQTIPVCLSNTTPASCGTRCIPCPEAKPACDAVAGGKYECGVTCDANKKCGVGAAAVCCLANQMCTNGTCVAGAGGTGG